MKTVKQRNPVSIGPNAPESVPGKRKHPHPSLHILDLSILYTPEPRHAAPLRKVVPELIRLIVQLGAKTPRLERRGGSPNLVYRPSSKAGSMPGRAMCSILPSSQYLLGRSSSQAFRSLQEIFFISMYTKLVIEIKESGFINNVCLIFSSIAFVLHTPCVRKKL
ncbi:hypothetical protein TcasGA2_TC032472 [Tribolium castaneum]|uniref:Uncharacterized protein n=1 Tax=Tribolium castaneum TaxID=7070 RepID=A0A139WLK4_TRICA|nr:hypothetical protein TcasGA2_TC032472 [Tribolium castaneum]